MSICFFFRFQNERFSNRIIDVVVRMFHIWFCLLECRPSVSNKRLIDYTILQQACILCRKKRTQPCQEDSRHGTEKHEMLRIPYFCPARLPLLAGN